MKRLRSLEDANAEAWERHHRRDQEAKNGSLSGIACPACGKELREDRTITLTSDPPQRNVWCDACGHRGYRTI